MRRSFKPIPIEPLLPAVVATKSSLPQTASGSGRLGRTVLSCASIALTTVYPRVPSTGRPAYRADRFVTPDSGPWMSVQGRKRKSVELQQQAGVIYKRRPELSGRCAYHPTFEALGRVWPRHLRDQPTGRRSSIQA